MTVSSAIALFGTMLVLAAIPSPSVFAVIARSLASGLGQGMMTVIGIVAGDLIFILLAVYGLASIAATMSHLFVMIKYLGSAYLIWLGVALWRAKSGTASAVSERPERHELSGLANVLCGLFITLGDPKAILFYISFLPAFLDLSQVSIVDTGLIMASATLAVGGTKLGYAYMADRSRVFLKNAIAQKAMNITAGSVMILTGIFLVAKS